MSVMFTVTCPHCHDQLNCDVDLVVSAAADHAVHVIPHITDASQARITAHTATH